MSNLIKESNNELGLNRQIDNLTTIRKLMKEMKLTKIKSIESLDQIIDILESSKATNKIKSSNPYNLKDGQSFHVININVYDDYEIEDYPRWDSNNSEYLHLRDMGLVFTSYDKALDYIERKEIITKLMKYGGRLEFIPGVPNWTFGLDYGGKSRKFLTVKCTAKSYVGNIYFDSKNDLIRAINKVGNHKILKLFGNIDEYSR